MDHDGRHPSVQPGNLGPRLGRFLLRGLSRLPRPKRNVPAARPAVCGHGRDPRPHQGPVRSPERLFKRPGESGALGAQSCLHRVCHFMALVLYRGGLMVTPFRPGAHSAVGTALAAPTLNMGVSNNVGSYISALDPSLVPRPYFYIKVTGAKNRAR